MRFPVTDMKVGDSGKVVAIIGGRGAKENLTSRGIIVGKLVKVISKMPLNGPLVIEVDGIRTAIGRGLASKIIVEKVKM